MAVRVVRTGGVALAVLACLGAAACSGGSGGGSSGTPSAAAGACPAPVIKAATERPAPKPAVTVAAQYLAVREGWLSACRPSTSSWESRAKKLMTERGWRTHPRDRVDVKQVRGRMTAGGWNVRVTVSCMTNREMGPPKPTWQPLFCGVTDTTVDALGASVPAAKLPAKWPFAGGQNPAPMAVVKRGGAWLVDQDLTGLAQ